MRPVAASLVDTVVVGQHARPAPVPHGPPGRRPGRTRVLVIAATLVAVIAVAVGLWAATDGTDGSSSGSGRATSTTAPASTTSGSERQPFVVTDTIRVGNNPDTPVATDDAIWIPNGGDGTISRIELG